MTSLLSTPGKYRSRKEWSTSSIPTLMSLEEETSQVIPYNSNGNGNHNNNFIDVNESIIRKFSDSIVPSSTKTIFEDEQQDKVEDMKKPEPKQNGVPTKDEKNFRRRSIGLGLLGRSSHSNNNNTANKQDNKRRRSIAGAFLGRRDKQKDSVVEKYYRRTTEPSDTENDPPIIRISEDYDMKEKKRRKSSWQAKLERRRRKENATIGDGDFVDFNTNGTNYLDQINQVEYRQKRHSWWNIFVPDNLKNRSRRSSQDIGIPDGNGIVDKIPYRRSKSRSVDHGLAAPFDLDSLRSKVEGRFESIDRLSAKGAPSAPVPTVTYTVGDRDTLASIAARFDTTPSELTQINKLGSSFIYSGQTLQVPDKSKINQDDNSSETSGDTDSTKDRKQSTDEIPQQEKDLLDDLRPSSPKPGRIERVVTPSTGTNDPNAATTNPDDDPVTIQRFLKINVRHITDGQGVVGGVLLVTPNAVMFDPNVSDPLVLEHGPESYGVIAPMEFIVNAAIFNDIAHMRVGSVEHNPTSSSEKPEVYHPKECNRCDTHSPGKDSLLVKDETFPELGVGSVDQESNCSSTDRDGDAFPKAFERELVTPNNLERLHADSTESAGSSALSTIKDLKEDKIDERDEEGLTEKSHEERRRSLIDQHWAIPSKDRSDDEEEDEAKKDKEDGEKNREIPVEGAENKENENSLSKTSCHDSGIDIRDALPIPQVPVIPTKKVYSDADLVLSSDWVPPLTLPSHLSNDSKLQTSLSLHSQDSVPTSTTDSGRKKTSSVSFSVDENSENSQSSNDKSNENKKNKMLKRLSYPLAWVEGLTGESGGSGTPKDQDSAPNTSDSTQSVFSKVFSSSPITLVSEFGGNLFLSKTPSEESGGSPVPPLTPHESQTATGGRRDSTPVLSIAESPKLSKFSKSNSRFRRSSIGTFIRSSTDSSTSSQSGKKPPPPKLDYRSMVSIDDMPALFVSFDKLIPRPARACPDPPMYLRLRMGRQIGKNTALPTTVMSYGKNKLRPEYWFSIPKNKVDELYRFLNAWVAYLYGELDEEAIKTRGYELIQQDTEWSNNRSSSKDGGSDVGDEISEYTRESWEVLSLSKDDYRKAALFSTGSFAEDFPIPDLIGTTEILSEEHREKLCAHLPARAEGYQWTLVFSTSQHGFSLNSLYRKMHKLESPVLIVIQDTEQNVFGALTSCALHVSDHFYGTGESLLYKFNPNFKVFHWSGENLYFIKGNPESLAIGAGDGRFGLWLDGDLNQGRSQSCSTYANEPLAPQEDFVVKTLECWAFV